MAWWEEMFELPSWQGVQLGWESLEDAEQQVDRIERALRLEPGGRILDVPCGTGRVGRRLAAKGYDVVGVDITERFLEEARRAGLTVERADMRELPFDAEFDAAVCMWGSFGYFDDEGNLAQARCGRSRLAPRRPVPDRHADARVHLSAVPRPVLVRGRRHHRPDGERVPAGRRSRRDRVDVPARR